MPTYAAMWMDFSGSNCAIKMSLGRINVLTGRKQDEKPAPDVQDYIAGGIQPWLDGLNVGNNEVRQFTAVQINNGDTIEEQLSDEPAQHFLQIDVMRTKRQIMTPVIKQDGFTLRVA